MTTTSTFQKNNDFYMSEENCKNSKIKYQTNPRYKYFSQTHFTAGDEEQFQQYRYNINNYFESSVNDISLESNLFKNNNTKLWKKYKDVNSDACINTFRYIFYKFKKGIFVKIVDNKLKVFLPFSNVNFSNEWSHKIKIDPKYKNNSKSILFNDFFSYISLKSGYYFNPRKVNNNIEEWYSNNCLIRYDLSFVEHEKIKGYFPTEGDSNTGTIKNMLEELCSSRKIPDIEFFINRRDFPIITKDETEPYNNIWDSENKKLLSHNYSNYLPIFSMCSSDRYADIKIPTWEDWSRVQNKENIWFPKTCKHYNIEFNKKWEEKIPTAVFRGSSTGCGVTIDTNPRLKISYLSHITSPDKNGIKYINAGITKWNLRSRKIQGEKYLQTIDIDKLPFDLSDEMTLEEQSEYKYIINIDGHVSAFRLSIELNMGSVILLVDSEWDLWYKNMLIPYEHYIPIKSDLSDILEKIKWCRKNDKICKKISLNARKFYKKYLQKNGILDYMQKTIFDIKKNMGVYLYNSKKLIDIVIDREYKELSIKYPKTDKNINSISIIPNIDRCYSLLKGIEWVINMILDKNMFETIANEKGKIFKNKLGIIRKFNISNFDFAVKSTNDNQKIKEHIHECYLGQKSINKLSKFIPNFVYIFGLYEKNNTINVITEFIEGFTLFEYINSNEFEFDKFIFILIQISLALNLSQKLNGLVHYDLTPWNIILHKTKTYKTFDYIISHDNIIRVKTDVIPVIIDYGKSHVIYKNEHHGFINMFNTSTIQDIITLLTKSIDQILNVKNLSKYDLSKLFVLINFITNTKYKEKSFSNTRELRKFLKKTKKYTYLIDSEKYDLENLTPLDFINYIKNNIKVDFNIKYVKVYNNINVGNQRQIFDYILSKTDDERKNSYINFFNKIKNCNFPVSENLLVNYYSAQELYYKIFTTKNHFDKFLLSNNIQDNSVNILYNDVLTSLSEFYINKINTTKPDNINYNITNDYIKDINYNDEIFLLPKKIDSLISKINKKNYKTFDGSEYINIFELLCLNNGKFKLNTKHKNFYLNNFSNLLNSDTLYIKDQIANINSIYIITKILYTNNQNKLKNSILNKNHTILYTEILNKIK
jgi:hypothetical protein